MRMKSVVFCSVVVFFTSHLQAKEKEINCDDLSNQAEMNACNCRQFEEHNNLLNQTFAEVLRTYQQDKSAIKRIKVAQKIWLMFRDAYIESIYPAGTLGSIVPTCVCNTKYYLTTERISQLRAMLNPMEGDMCAGRVSLEQ